jgi:hypothetical protein
MYGTEQLQEVRLFFSNNAHFQRAGSIAQHAHCAVSDNIAVAYVWRCWSSAEQLQEVTLPPLKPAQSFNNLLQYRPCCSLVVIRL